MKIDPKKLAASPNGVPYGFRELTAEELPSPGDVFRRDGPTFEEQRYESKSPYRGGPVGWRPHFRRVENPAGIPENFGIVADGPTQAGDIQWGQITGFYVLPTPSTSVSSFNATKIYRYQPGFVGATAKNCIGAYKGTPIPPGFRELLVGESRIEKTPVFFHASNYGSPDWETGATAEPYSDQLNPSIVRCSVGPDAPLLRCEIDVTKTSERPLAENVTQAQASGPTFFGIDWAVGEKDKKIEELEKLVGNLTSQCNRERTAAEVWVKKLREAEQELTAQKAANGILRETDKQRSEAIDRIEASCNIRVNNLWNANTKLQAERNELECDLDRSQLANTCLRDQKRVLEAKLKDAEATAEQRRIRVAHLECNILKAKQELSNTHGPCPVVFSGIKYRKLGGHELPKIGDVFVDVGEPFDPYFRVLVGYSHDVAHHQTLVVKPVDFYRPL